MSRASVVSLTESLVRTAISPARLGEFYDEAVLALSADEVVVSATFLPVVAGTPTVTLLDPPVRVRTVFFNATELLRAEAPQLDALSATWQTATGEPVNWLVEYERERTIRLYPVPAASSPGLWPYPNGEPFGRDYPPNMLCVWTTDRTDAVPGWLDLPVACAIAARELTRSSAQQDPALAQRLVRLGTGLRRMMGPP